MSLDISKADGMLKKTLEKLSSSSQPDKICSDIYELLHEKNAGSKKADFALDMIYSVDPEKLGVPKYIEEGLDWLQECLIEEN